MPASYRCSRRPPRWCTRCSAPKYQGLAGLVRKYYLYDADGKTGGGCYLWESREAAERVYNAEWRKMITDRYGSPRPEISLRTETRAVAGRQQPGQHPSTRRNRSRCLTLVLLWGSTGARRRHAATLNRPEVNNAYDAGLINGVLAGDGGAFGKRSRNLRVVVLKGNGKHFQAGADLKWINGDRAAIVSEEENEAVSRATFFEAGAAAQLVAGHDRRAGAGRAVSTTAPASSRPATL